MKIKEIRALSEPEISKKIRDSRHELMDLRLRKKAGQVENSAQLRSLRQDIARMETILKERATAAAN